MAFIEWSEDLSVNVSEIDAEHKRLVAMLNELNDAMHMRKGKEVVGKIIDGLINYAGSHFKTEEKYFDKLDYPEALRHKSEHSDFVKKVCEFRTGFESGKLSLTVDVLFFLTDWLKTHIKGSDKEYGPFFNAHGLK